MSEKQCRICGFYKPLDGFHRMRGMRDGVNTICRQCDALRRKREYYENHDRELATAAVIRARKGREAANAYARQWRANNKEKLRATVKRWVEQNRDHVRVKNRIDTFNRRHAGHVAKDEWTALCESFGNVCLDCGEAKKLTMDHVIPFSRGGYHAIQNLQPLYGSCNSRKNRYVIIDFRMPWKRVEMLSQ